MILMSAIANITSNLDLIRQQDVKAISSHAKLKEEALDCLDKLIEKAPINEYKNMLASKNCDILIGYLMSILCHMAKNDKSRVIRLRSLEVMSILIKRLGHHHDQGYSREKCSISSLIIALPGISSTLFKIIMSDIKLNHKILVMAIKNLTNLLRVSFLECHHDNVPEDQSETQVPTKLVGSHLDETCDNLAARIKILLEYIMNNNRELHLDVRLEMINLSTSLVTYNLGLLRRLMKILIRYIAYLKSSTDENNEHDRFRVAIDKLVTNLENQVKSKKQDLSDIDLDMSLLNCLFGILDNLENYALNMLPNERHTEIGALCGTIEIMTPSACTTFLEVPHRNDQFFNILILLTKFNTSHSLLFLTDTQIGEQALELMTERIYTIEKQFSHLSELEIAIVRNCCRLVGKKTAWPMLNDILKNDLIDFGNPSKLFLTHHILEGLFDQSDIGEIQRFANQILYTYIDEIQEHIVVINRDLDNTYSGDILKTVIAIETLALIVELNLKCVADRQRGHSTLTLKDLLCPLLNWCSSKSRAISETSLNILTKIGRLYGHTSTKDFIQNYTDYIVDGVTHMLNDFACNPEVTHVLAITFKLSSIEVFYYFKDVYERIFRLLEAYHYTDRSKFIALLFYRTLKILNDWSDSKQMQSSSGIILDVPLMSESSIKTIVRDISINIRLDKLRRDREENEKLRLEMESIQVHREDDEKKVLKRIENSETPIGQDENMSDTDEGDVVKKKAEEIVLTEKIMKHCIGLMSSRYSETKILALKTAALGFRILREDEDALLPLVHLLWPPLLSRLTSDYNQNLEVSFCAFECLATLATYSKDFITGRALDSIIPRICLFLESQSHQSRGKKEYEPYCMTMAYKSQLSLLTHLGPLVYNIQLGYINLWRVIKVALLYLEQSQVPSLREAAQTSLNYMIALDADCVWYYAKLANQLNELPFEKIYETF